MKPVAEALGVSRPHLSATSRRPGKPRSDYECCGDAVLLERIEVTVKARPSYGYRRITALLNRQKPLQRVNHKRVYRLMKRAKLLLPKYAAKQQRPHEGKVVTLASDLRWCSDACELRCWNGERVRLAFALDCCDREVIAWMATDGHIDGADIRDLMAQAIEARFASTHTPHPVEWLSDNGPPYTAHDTRAFGRQSGLLVRNTPSYSPESNGMAEAFVKTLKRDYAYLNDVSSAAVVMAQLPDWFADYNEHHPHKGLNMLSPRQFRRRNSSIERAKDGRMSTEQTEWRHVTGHEVLGGGPWRVLVTDDWFSDPSSSTCVGDVLDGERFTSGFASLRSHSGRIPVRSAPGIALRPGPKS